MCQLVTVFKMIAAMLIFLIKILTSWVSLLSILIASHYYRDTAMEAVKIITVQVPTQFEVEIDPWFGLREKILVELITSVLVCLGLRLLVRIAFPYHSIAKGFVPEKMVQGSVLMKEDMPNFQAKIFGKQGRELVRAGQGFRVNERFVTAAHVVANFDELVIVSEFGEVTIPASRFEIAEGDVSSLVLSPQELGALKIASCKLHPNAFSENCGLFCKATGFGQSSLGILDVHPAFGFSIYRGSTVGGFSGAPYFVGNKVYGMHLGGSTENLGYVSAYLAMLLKAGKEDSDEFLVSQIRKLGDYSYEQSPYDPDEYRLRIGKRFHLVDSDVMAKVLNKTSLTFQGESERPVSVKVSVPSPQTSEPALDAIVESIENLLGNGVSPVIADVTGLVGKSSNPTVVVAKPQPLPRATTSSTPANSDSNGLKQARALRDEVLRDISESLKKLRAGRASLQERFSNKALKKQSSSSQFGKLDQYREQLLKIASDIGSITVSNSST